MSIQIVDNFSLGTDKPIDNRFVVGPGQFYLNRDSIQNKYIGLRIWDINDNSAYVWKGSIWEVETSGGGGGTGTVGPGTSGRISKFTSSTTIGDSIIEEQDGKIIITGLLQATSIQGIGTNITQINAGNISTGVLSPSRLQGPSNHILLGQGLGLPSVWTSLNNITGIPVGGIIIWMLNDPPFGFFNCDGSIYELNGQAIQVPDFRSKYLIGDSDVYILGVSGNMNTSSNGDSPYKYTAVRFIIYLGGDAILIQGPNDTGGDTGGGDTGGDGGNTSVTGGDTGGGDTGQDPGGDTG